ncbi:MAG TPA: MFS transporter, partial [Ktedonobacteraceae bacterium]|nr:MFS transporter [Ktedonobacteraceae bacterium]
MTKAYRWRVAAVVAIGLFMAILDNTIVSVTLPQMQKAFHTDFETITWVATAYFLAQAAVIPIVGYLSDRIGTKLVFLTALTLFTVGSALCALAPTKEALIAFRVFQGIGGGALLPMAFAIIFRIFPPTERGMATAMLGIPIMMAPAFGPTIGGFLSTNFAWNAIFTINVPIGVVALILAVLTLPGRKAESENQVAPAGKKRFDILGLVLSMVGFTA